MLSFEDGRMMCLVSKVWNAICVGWWNSNVIVVLDYQFQEKARNRDLTDIEKEPVLWAMGSLVRIRPPAK